LRIEQITINSSYDPIDLKNKKESWLFYCLLVNDMDPKYPIDFLLHFSLMKKNINS